MNPAGSVLVSRASRVLPPAEENATFRARMLTRVKYGCLQMSTIVTAKSMHVLTVNDGYRVRDIAFRVGVSESGAKVINAR